MTGIRDILRIQRLEKEANELGFVLGNPKNGYYNNEWGDVVAVFPKDGKLPIYSREAELFLGTLEDLEIWMAAEDFAYYSYRYPALFMLIGTNNDDSTTQYGLHNPQFNLDEKAFETSMAVLVNAAISLLNESKVPFNADFNNLIM